MIVNYAESFAELAGIQLRRLANQSSSASKETAGKKRKSFTRADQELRYRDFCLARLEDKPVGDETGRAQLEADVKRFSAAWCGDMPSVLFVATSGARATLLAFGRDSTARAFRELDLSSAAGRQELFIAIVSVVFYGVARIVQEDWHLGSGRVTIIHHNVDPFVRKVYDLSIEGDKRAAEVLCDRLQAFYNATRHVVGVEHALSDSVALSPPVAELQSQTVTVNLRPCGVTRRPRSDSEALTALQQLAITLADIHRAGWVHCDVRWPNVVLDIRQRRWTLIDAEYACPSGSPWSAAHQLLKAIQHDPCDAARASLTPLSDMFALGCLFLSLNLLTDKWRPLLTALVGSDRSARELAFAEAQRAC